VNVYEYQLGNNVMIAAREQCLMLQQNVGSNFIVMETIRSKTVKIRTSHENQFIRIKAHP